jgi:hypothetical protein
MEADTRCIHYADPPIVLGNGLQRIRPRRSQPVHYSLILARALRNRFSIHIHVDRDDTADL